MADDDGWEARMAARTRERRDGLAKPIHYGLRRGTWDFSVYRQPGESEDILPQILAARCLGITYGDPGPRLEPDACRECWGDRYVWYGNCWGLRHVGLGLGDCEHPCHEGEVLLA